MPTASWWACAGGEVGDRACRNQTQLRPPWFRACAGRIACGGRLGTQSIILMAAIGFASGTNNILLQSKGIFTTAVRPVLVHLSVARQLQKRSAYVLLSSDLAYHVFKPVQATPLSGTARVPMDCKRFAANRFAFPADHVLLHTRITVA